jgi:hypothetical protein
MVGSVDFSGGGGDGSVLGLEAPLPSELLLADDDSAVF